MTRQGTKLSVEIPPAKLGSEQAYTGVFALAWNAFVAYWTVGALASGGIIFALFSLPFWFAGATLGKSALARSLIRENLDIGRQKWQISQQLSFLKAGKPAVKGNPAGKDFGGRTKDLSGASMVTSGFVNGVETRHIQLTEGVNQHIIGEGLSKTEQVWLTSAINEHLKRLGNDVSQASAAQERWLQRPSAERFMPSENDSFDFWDQDIPNRRFWDGSPDDTSGDDNRRNRK